MIGVVSVKRIIEIEFFFFFFSNMIVIFVIG